MAKILRCKDVGVECDFMASGKTVEKVLKKAAEHARKDHGIKRITKDYKDSWRKLIRNAKGRTNKSSIALKSSNNKHN